MRFGLRGKVRLALTEELVSGLRLIKLSAKPQTASNFVKRANGLTRMRRASPNSSFLKRASNLQILGNLGSYVAAPNGALVVDASGAYVYSEA